MTLRPPLTIIVALTLISVLVVVWPAFSQDQKPEGGETTSPAPTPPPEPTPDATAAPPAAEVPPAAPRRYFAYAMEIERQIEAESDLLMWGRLPMPTHINTLGARMGYQHRRIDSIYLSNGEQSDVLADFTVADPFGSEGRFLSVESSLTGRLHRLNLEASYGITDTLTLYSRLPLQREELKLDFDLVAGTSATVGIRSTHDWFRMLEHLGRPAPTHRYQSKAWELGDVEAGLVWNYVRSSAADLTLAVRGVFPTGRLADPNEALIYGLGPQIDVGSGSYAAGLSHRVDYWLPLHERWVALVLEMNYDYFFRGKRRVPQFLEPDPTFYARLDEIDIDPRYFPDLSDSDDYYWVTPGSRFDYLAGTAFRFHYFSVGAGFACSWEEKPRLRGDADLRAMLDATEAYPSRTYMEVVGQVGVPLSYIYVPGILGVDLRYPVSGRNTLREDVNFAIQLQFYLPL